MLKRRHEGALGIASKVVIAWFVLNATGVQADSEGKTLALYGVAAAERTPPPGWDFAWNAKGEIGDSRGYSPLSFVEASSAYGALSESGQLRSDAPSHNISRDNRYFDISAMTDSAGIARFYIASYTLPEDSSGDVWVNHGNLRNRSFPEGTAVKIYVNEMLKSQWLFKQDRFAGVFQANLGRLKKGDTIRVAVGPGVGAAKAGGRLFFIIEDVPNGQKPAEPINILSPAINGANPQQAADGTIDPAYAAKHQAQCEALLANNSELIFIGDSITARWPAEDLQEAFGSFRPANLGIGGDWFQNVRWRVENGVLDKIHPKAIVLLVGTNNISARLTPDEIAQGMDYLLKAIQEKAPAAKILLLGILPRGESIAGETNETIRLTNTKLASLADEKRIFYLDVGDRLVEPDGTIRSDLMPDKLHVAAPGYKRWMDAMKPALDKLLKE